MQIPSCAFLSQAPLLPPPPTPPQLHSLLVLTQQDTAEVTMPCDACGLNAEKYWPPLFYDHLPFAGHGTCDPAVTVATVMRGHRSYKAGRHTGTVALFREPRSRLVSGYNYDKHAFGLGKEKKETFYDRVQNLSDYINTPEILSCSTKMLLGKMCAQEYKVTNDDLRTAINNLHSLAFVGLTEAFNASVCLFHLMYGGPVYPFEFVHVREAEPYAPNESYRLPGGHKRVPPSTW